MFRVLATYLVLVCLPALACTARAQSPDPPSSDQTHLSPDDFLKQLSDPDWRQRRQGMQQLLQAGDEAERVLADLLRRDLDQETRKNVETALHLVRDNRILGPSLITLHVKDASPGDVFSAVSQQCHDPVPCEPDDLWKQKGWPKLALDFDHRPFWQVIQDLSPRLGLEYLSSDPDEVRLSRGSNRPDNACISGAFLLTANAVGFRNRLVIDVAVYGEPKISILRSGQMKVDEGVDETGKPLLPQTGRFFGRGFGRFGRRGRFGRPLSLLFQKPADSVSRVGKLKGTVSIFVATGNSNWEIADPLSMASATRVIDSIPVTLESLAGNARKDVFELQLIIPWSARGLQQDEIMDLIRNRMKLLDAAGRQFVFSAIDSRSAADGTEILVDFSRAPGWNALTGQPARLTWEVPSEVRELTVPFEFKDLLISDPWN